jgi:hypothetical protein
VLATRSVISAQAGPPGSAPVPPAAPSPEIEGERRTALASWQRDAQQALDRCVARPVPDRRPTPLIVWLAPLPRSRASATQTLMARSITLPLTEIERLRHDIDPVALQGCVERLRGLATTVALTGDAADREFPVSADNVVVQL